MLRLRRRCRTTRAGARASAQRQIMGIEGQFQVEGRLSELNQAELGMPASLHP